VVSLDLREDQVFLVRLDAMDVQEITVNQVHLEIMASPDVPETTDSLVSRERVESAARQDRQAILARLALPGKTVTEAKTAFPGDQDSKVDPVQVAHQDREDNAVFLVAMASLVNLANPAWTLDTALAQHHLPSGIVSKKVQH